MSRVPGSLPPLDRGIFFVHISRARKHLAEERFDLARKELELADLAKPNEEEVLRRTPVSTLTQVQAASAVRAFKGTAAPIEVEKK